MHRLTSIPVVFSTLLLIAISSAQQPAGTSVPNLIRYSGTLKDANGAPLAGALGVTFAIYKQQDSGAPVWMETQNVTSDANGQYTVILGSTTATGLPSDLFSQEEQRWLGVQVQGQSEQARVLLVSVPYAFKAHEAETLGGLPASAFVKAAPTDTSSDGSSGAALNALSNAGGAGGTSTTNGKTTAGKPKTFAPCSTIGGAGTLNFIPLWTPDGCTLGNSLMSQLTAGRVDVNGDFNLASTPGGYQIGSNTVLSIGSPTDDNLFLGAGAGAHNTAGRGQANTFSGYNAGANNTTGAANMFSGTGAGLSNLAGGENTFSGAWAGVSNTSGGRNTFSGWRAGYSNHTGDYNTFVGAQAGTGNTSGSDNTFSGYQAGYSNTTGGSTTFYGYQAGYSNTTGGDNSFSGYQAGYSNTVGADNTFSGFQAGYRNTLGQQNTFSGYQAGYMNIGDAGGDGWKNTFSGYQAGYSNTTGEANTFVGDGAGLRNTTGPFNTFVGVVAGYSNTTGDSNTSVGTGAGYNNSTGIWNTFLGYNAGEQNTTGSYNTFSGYQAGDNNTTGQQNTFSGYMAGYSNTTGSSNAFFGVAVGMGATTGSYNTYSGVSAGDNNTGSYNTYYGYAAGDQNTTGSYNVDIANFGCPYPCSESNTIRIGEPYSAQMDGCPNGPPPCGQNVAYIVGIYGSTSAAGVPVYVNSDGQLGTQTSSLRFKEQIADMGDSSSALLKLRPVTFLYKPEYDKGVRTLQYGLIAEEVAEVYPDMVAYDKDGQPYTVKYQYLAPMLLNEVQKQYRRAEAEAKVITAQQDQVDAQREQMKAQEQRIGDLEQRLSRLETLLGTQVKIAEASAPSAGTQ